MAQPKDPPNDSPKPPEPAPPQVVQLPMEFLQGMLASMQAIAAKANTPAEAAQAQSPEFLAAIEGLRAATAMSTQLKNATDAQTRRSNFDHKHLSVFDQDPRCAICKAGEIHPETGHMGHPKPPLKHITYFCWGLVREDQCTPIEIELYNSFDVSREARNGSWTATLERGTATRKKLDIRVPCKTIDELQSLPDRLDLILIELLHGTTAVDPMAQMQRIDELNKRLADMEARLAASEGKAAPATA